MKNSILFAIVLLLTSVVDLWAADYDGATKYPSTTLVSGQFTLVVSGVVQTKTFSQLHTALSAAVVISQKCSCEVLIKSPDIRINTKWKIVVPGETPITFNWARPTSRLNGDLLTANEIGGYELVRLTAAGLYTDRSTIGGKGLDDIQYTTTMQYSPNDMFLVAAIDSNGLYSSFVEIQPIIGKM